MVHDCLRLIVSTWGAMECDMWQLLYNGSLWKECSLYWWSLGRIPLALVVSGNNAPNIGGQ